MRTPDLVLDVGGGDPVRLRCAAVLFDMDGTLVDSHACVEWKWRTWCAGHGIDADALLVVAHGRPQAETVRIVAPELDTERELDHLTRLEEGCTTGIVEVPGASALLDALPAGTWAVVTSAWRRLLRIRMGCAGLPLPAVTVTADDPVDGKPSPHGYLSAAARLGVRPADCVVVEDTPVGLAAGQAAGMRTIALATTFPADRLPAGLVVPDLTQVRLHRPGGGGPSPATGPDRKE
ncbi:HAD-IA family hydrolase [Micromonospora carbonacea]|uniref:HAD-IA family hydrolase n=1 Tax=Micromonospora carbonacea TaxID=47853 RepID=UPI003722B82C